MNILLDLIFIIDTTGSMGDMLTNAKRFMTDSIKSLSIDLPLEVLTSVIEYKDHPPQDNCPYRVAANRVEVSKIQKKIDPLNPSGGGDTAESGFDGVMAIDKLSWDEHPSMMKLAFLIGDAPLHGTKAAKGYSDGKHIDACQCGVTANDVKRSLEGHNLQLHGYVVSNHQSTADSFEEFCSSVSLTHPHHVISDIKERAIQASRLHQWSVESLLPELKEDPRVKIVELSSRLERTSNDIHTGIEILNEFGYTTELMTA